MPPPNPPTPAHETTDLLQRLIRNRCVNDGTAASGSESRNADLIESHLQGPGLELEHFEPLPGRRSLVARIEGSDPTAPTLLLMGHTDVVPANPAGWSRDPFAGELVDGFVWGRGAIDMLNLTASMAVAVRRLAAAQWRPRGTLVYLAVADEEAGGTHGASWLVDHARDAVGADFVVTESGGVPVDTPAGRRLWVRVGEKGVCWTRLVVRGTPGHGSRPFGADNALVKAAEVVRRLAALEPPAVVGEVWRRFVAGMGLPAEVAAALVDPARVGEGIDRLEVGMRSIAHASTHTTVAPTTIRGGTKVNVIPDRVELEVDVRILPGQTAEEARAMLGAALGDLAADVEMEAISDAPASVSPVDTPLWAALERAARRLAPEATLLPSFTVGATDARFFRAIGVPAYGFGLFSDRMDIATFTSMFHGNDERVDVESLRLSVELWEWLARELLG